MRVGILTFHYGRNYGALLQAYGLRKAIESLGHDASVIHYIPEYCSYYMSPKETPWLRLGWRTYGPRLAIERRLRTYRFNRFKRKELRLTQRCHSKEDLSQQVAGLDVLVVGSDQVWNLNFVHSDDLCYFLDFPRQDQLRCISYAACCGRKDQPPERLSRVAELLANFHAIGVRNDVTTEFVSSLSGRNATVVADPTLLVDFGAIEDGHVPDSRYILVYALEQTSFEAYAKVIGALKQRFRLPVWAVADGDVRWGETPFPGADQNCIGIMPGRFLSLLKHASCIVTDSFHGTIFSVKYRKPFLTLNDGGWRNMRMLDLSNRYEIGHRIKSVHDPIDDTLLTKTEDLTSIQERFDLHKVVSYEFLRKSLSGEQPS